MDSAVDSISAAKADLQRELERLDRSILAAQEDGDYALVADFEEQKDRLRIAHASKVASIRSRTSLEIVRDTDQEPVYVPGFGNEPRLLAKDTGAVGVHLLCDLIKRKSTLTFERTFETALDLIDQECGKSIVASQGQIWRYNRTSGVWEALEQEMLERHVAGYFNASVDGKTPYRCTAWTLRDAIEFGKMRVGDREFFDNPVRGIAAGNGFLKLHQPPVDGQYLSYVDHSPAYRCRSGYSFSLGSDIDRLFELQPYENHFLAFHPEWMAVMPTYLETCYGAWLRGNSDPEMDARFMQEFEGISMLGIAPTFARALFIRGTGGTDIDSGNNGKGAYYNLLARTFPSGSVRGALDLSSWKQPHERTGLMGGKLLGLMDEVSHIGNPDLFRIVVTGGDINARFTGANSGPAFTYRPIAGIVMAGHELPNLPAKHLNGVARRLAFVDFQNIFKRGSNYIPEAELFARIQPELPYIFAWRLAGALRALQAGDYTQPSGQASAIKTFVAENDPLIQFWDDCVEISESARTHSGTVWSRFKSWSEHANQKLTMTQIGFAKAFKQIATKRGATHDPNNKVYRGIALSGEDYEAR